MSEPRTVAVATFGRSDFSILRPLCRRIDATDGFDLTMWVGGAHFEAVSGRTIADIESSGLSIGARIDGGGYDRTALGTVEMMAAQMTGFARAAAGGASGATPDLVLILGDRFEAVAAGLAMVPLGIPVGHISGGSITEGAMDDVFRHCLTKIAALHFCDLPQFARRIQLMGEEPSRIFTTGALGLDAFGDEPRPFDEFVAAFGLDGLAPGFALATLHPESRHPEHTVPMAESMVRALEQTSQQVVFTYPNADPGSDDVIERIERAAMRDGAFCIRGFGADWYPTAMAHAGLMIGNSSGGIIEAATFGLPVVDIGDRQKRRDVGLNVIHCERTTSSIVAAIDTATDPNFAPRAESGNIYGDGRASERVMTVLRNLNWDGLRVPKPFADPDHDFAGQLLELP